MRCFFDTNILLYQYDASDPRKQSIADTLIKKSLVDQEFVISTQVMMEFYNVACRKYESHFSPTRLNRLMLEFAECEPIMLTPQIIVDAVLIHQKQRVSWWDSTVICAALHAQADILYSEDLQHGREFDGLHIVDPFRAATSVNEPTPTTRTRRRR